jgi:hypothetical protein
VKKKDEWLPGQIVEIRGRPNLRGTVLGWKPSGGGKIVKVKLIDPPETTYFAQGILRKLDAIEMLGRIADVE